MADLNETKDIDEICHGAVSYELIFTKNLAKALSKRKIGT